MALECSVLAVFVSFCQALSCQCRNIMYTLSIYGEYPGGGWSVTQCGSLPGDSVLLIELIADALRNGKEIKIEKVKR